MKVLLAAAFFFALSVDCGTSPPQVKATDPSVETVSACQKKYSAVCTMEFDPTVCKAVGPNQERFQIKGGNRCGATTNIRIAACTAGLNEAMIKNLAIVCEKDTGGTK